jgi:hypothetical protein
MVAASLATASVAAEPLLTNTTSFRIPFTVKSTGGRSTEGFAVLFGSRDGGPMQQLQRVPTATGGFRFSAPADGVWQFALRMTDAAGKPDKSSGPLMPELEVIVDTTAPTLQLELVDAGDGTVLVNWVGKEEEFVPGSLSLKYAEGADGRWKPLSVPPSSSGQTTIRSRPGTSVAVRAELADRVGNTGSISREIVLAATPVVPQSTPQLNNGSVWNNPGRSLPPALSTPVGPSPFSQVPPAASPQTPLGSPGFPSAAMSPQYPAPTLPGRAIHLTPQTLISSQGTPGIYMPNATPPNQPWQSAAQQPGVLAQSTVPGQAASQLVADSVFNVAYAVEDIGPSGVSSVELFVTEDDGQQWFRYGNDTDLQSPMQVDVQGEGTFGFAIRVRNGVGFIDPPPQPGDRPEIVVTVDRTAPVVEIKMPQVHVSGTASVQLEWNVRDSQQTAVRLEWASSATGPWVPVFDWQADRGHYEWPVSPNMPHSIHFRLLARDEAGNIGSAQTAQPVLIDLKRPKARMLGVQAVSQNIGY